MSGPEFDFPICPVCKEAVTYGVGDPSGVWWHRDCFRQVVRKGGVVPPATDSLAAPTSETTLEGKEP